jgi:hypothetical protein
MIRPNHTDMVLLFCVLSLFVSCANHKDAIKAQADRLYAEARLKEPLPPKPFVSDGCSRWFNGNWVDCCVVHDFGYWMGGTREERKKCDLSLRNCVACKGHSFMADIMYLGVRIFGIWWLDAPFRWGFGWEYPQSGPPGKPY